MNQEGSIHSLFYSGSMFLRDKEPLKTQKITDNYPVEKDGKERNLQKKKFSWPVNMKSAEFQQ